MSANIVRNLETAAFLIVYLTFLENIKLEIQTKSIITKANNLCYGLSAPSFFKLGY